jgi:hypothetical protein
MIMHLGLPHWQYAFTQVGLDPQALQWFRFLSPERLAIDIENRKNQENLAKKKNNKGAKLSTAGASASDASKIKVEGLRRKKRRMKLKAKGGNGDHIIEKFTAQSSKSAKYAKTTVKKRDASVNNGGAGAASSSDVKENKADEGAGQGASSSGV